MGAQHRALAVADKLVRLARESEIPITPMQVQKLTYFAHAWNLGLGYGPVFQDAVESWQYGPVIRSVYHALKSYGSEPVTEPLLVEEEALSPEEDAVIKAIFQQYGELDGVKLSQMTHAEGSPWRQTYQEDRRSAIIHNYVIKDYYADLINKLNEQEREA
jgi:uncharacterized phage-associated protein